MVEFNNFVMVSHNIVHVVSHETFLAENESRLRPIKFGFIFAAAIEPVVEKENCLHGVPCLPSS